jgi:glutaredoxin
MILRPAAVLAIAIFLVSAHAQQLYRWVDKDGRVTYSQNPPPVGAARNVQSKSLGSTSTVETSALPYAAQVAMKNFPVTLHASPDCGSPCDSGRDYLQKRGIPFREVSVTDQKTLDQVKAVSGKIQVPVLQVGSRAESGFAAPAWKSALDDAGYPASIPPQRRSEGSAPVVRSLPDIRLYTNSQCGPVCKEARDLLVARGIGFKEVPVEDEETLTELKKYSETGSVPVLVMGTTILRGFDAARYQATLDSAGFARARAAR